MFYINLINNTLMQDWLVLAAASYATFYLSRLLVITDSLK